VERVGCVAGGLHGEQTAASPGQIDRVRFKDGHLHGVRVESGIPLWTNKQTRLSLNPRVELPARQP